MISMFEKQIFMQSIHALHNFLDLGLHVHMDVSKNRGTPKWMVCNGKLYQNGWFGGTTIFGNTHMSLLSVLCYQLYLLMGFLKPAMLLGSKPRPRMIHGPAAVSFCPTGISIRYACQPMDVLQIFPANINWLYEILSCKMSWWKAMPRRCLWRKAAPNPLNCYKQLASGPTRWAIGSEFPGCTGGVVLFHERPFCVSPVQKLQLLDTETHTHTHTNLNWSIALETASWFFFGCQGQSRALQQATANLEQQVA